MRRSHVSSHRSSRNRRFATLLAGLLVACVTLTGSLATGGEITIDGVLHVQNGEQPVNGTQTLQLKELWRVGGEDEDTIFGLIPRVADDAEGNIYVLDSQLCQVSVYSPDGDLLRTLFREGDGPGEVRAARDMLVLGDGRVGLVQEMPGEMVFVEANGDPAPKLVVGGDDPSQGGIVSMTACDGAGQTILLSGTDHSRGTDPGVAPRTNFVGRFDSDGQELARYAIVETAYNFNDFHFIEEEHMPSLWWCFAACEDGTAYVVPNRDKYEIHKFNPDGTLNRIIERQAETIRRSDKEISDTRGIVETALTSLPVEYTIVIKEDAAPIGYLQRGLRVRSDGSLWVISAGGIRENPDGVLITFDVFDSAGRFDRRVALAGEGDPLKDGVFFAGDDRIVVVKGYMESVAAQFGQGSTYSGEDGEEATVLELICYEMSQ